MSRHIKLNPHFSNRDIKQKRYDKRRRLDGELCPRCGKSFRDSFNLQRHVNNVHDSDINCMLCSYKSNEKELNTHYIVVHNVVMDIQHEVFESESNFDEWKDSVERKTCSRYIRGSTRKNKDGSLIVYYKCHRDGFYKSKGNNMRNLKNIGTNKINGRCPSYIRTCLIDGKINVKFIATHLGHTNDVERLSLTKHEKEAIADEIISGVPVDDVLRKIRKTIHSNGVKRIHLTTKKDINNIVTSYRLLETSDIDEIQEIYDTSVKDRKNEAKYFYGAEHSSENVLELPNENGKIGEESKINKFTETCKGKGYNEKCALFNEADVTCMGGATLQFLNNKIADDEALSPARSLFIEELSEDDQEFSSNQHSKNNVRCNKIDRSNDYQMVSYNSEDSICKSVAPSSDLIEGCVQLEDSSDSIALQQPVCIKVDSKQHLDVKPFRSNAELVFESRASFNNDKLILERKKEKFLDKICKMLDLVESKEDMESVLRHAVPLDSVISSLKNRTLSNVSQCKPVAMHLKDNSTELVPNVVLDHFQSLNDSIAYEVVIE